MKKQKLAAAVKTVTAVKAAENLVKPKHDNVWKCVAFLLIGIIGGYLLSPLKGGILIGGFNASKIKTPIKPPHRPERQSNKKEKNPFSGSIVIGSFNGTSSISDEDESFQEM